MNGIQMSHVTIRLRRSSQTLIDDFNLHVLPGQIAVVMGASGIGKSTLLAFIGGHLDPAFEATGSVIIDGQDVTCLAPEKRHIGIMFQDDLLFPHLSVGENLMFGLPSHIRGKAARKARVDAALTSAGLPNFAERDPASLSGGQRSRVALLRTLLSEPKALLLDEPFAKLDQSLRTDVRSFVFEHALAENLPVLMVTHDEADAKAAPGNVITLRG